MKLQKAEIERQTAGTGKRSLIIPARMIGTEHSTVTRIVRITLSRSVKRASNLDIVHYFR
jgi:hypothetical protein